MPRAQLVAVTLRALPALAVPAIVMIGIYGGFVTVTEAAALSALVALGVSLFFYRGFRWQQSLDVIAEAIRSAATIMIIIATALAFGQANDSELPRLNDSYGRWAASRAGTSTWRTGEP